MFLSKINQLKWNGSYWIFFISPSRSSVPSAPTQSCDPGGWPLSITSIPCPLDSNWVWPMGNTSRRLKWKSRDWLGSLSFHLFLLSCGLPVVMYLYTKPQSPSGSPSYSSSSANSSSSLPFQSKWGRSRFPMVAGSQGISPWLVPFALSISL